jgi:hypothetical protein
MSATRTQARPGSTGRRFGLALLACASGCGPAATAAEPSAPKATTFEPMRFVPADADVVIYVDQDQIRNSFYGSYAKRIWAAANALDVRPRALPKRAFPLDECNQAWMAGAWPSDPASSRGWGLFAGRGSCARAADAFMADAQIQKFGDDAFVAVSLDGAPSMGSTPREVKGAAAFDTSGAAIAVRFRPSRAMRSFFRSHVGGDEWDKLGVGEVRAFIRVDAGLAFWMQVVMTDERLAAPAEAKIAEGLQDLRRNVITPLFSLDRGLRTLTVTRAGATISVSLSMQADEAEAWIASIDQAVTRWQERGGENVILDIFRRATLVEVGPPETRGSKH